MSYFKVPGQYIASLGLDGDWLVITCCSAQCSVSDYCWLPYLDIPSPWGEDPTLQEYLLSACLLYVHWFRYFSRNSVLYRALLRGILWSCHLQIYSLSAVIIDMGLVLSYILCLDVWWWWVSYGQFHVGERVWVLKKRRKNIVVGNSEGRSGWGRARLVGNPLCELWCKSIVCFGNQFPSASLCCDISVCVYLFIVIVCCSCLMINFWSFSESLN